MKGLADMVQPKDRKSKGSSQQQEFAIRLLLEMTTEWSQVEKELAGLENREPQSIQDIATIPEDIFHSQNAETQSAPEDSKEKRKSKKVDDSKKKEKKEKRGTRVLGSILKRRSEGPEPQESPTSEHIATSTSDKE
jgi:hypothetical protein